MPWEGKDQNIPLLLHLHPAGSDTAGSRLSQGFRGISLPDVPCQLCNADVQCGVGCPARAKIIDEMGSREGSSRRQVPWACRQGRLSRLAGLEQSHVLLRTTLTLGAEQPRNTPGTAWCPWRPRWKDTAFWQQTLVKWDVRWMFLPPPPPPCSFSPMKSSRGTEIGKVLTPCAGGERVTFGLMPEEEHGARATTDQSRGMKKRNQSFFPCKPPSTISASGQDGLGLPKATGQP